MWVSVGGNWPRLNIVGGYAGKSQSATACSSASALLPPPFYHLWTATGGDVPAGMLLSLLLAVAIGMPTFRLQGHYFSMATIAVAELIRIFVGTWDLVGAAIGLQGPAVGRGWWDLTFRSELPYYYIFLAVLGAVLFTTFAVERSRFGYLCASRASAPRGARRAGAKQAKALMLSAVFTSVAGSLYSIKTGFTHPESGFGIRLGAMVIIAALATRLPGPLVGALILIPCRPRPIPGSAAAAPASLLLYGGIIVCSRGSNQAACMVWYRVAPRGVSVRSESGARTGL